MRLLDFADDIESLGEEATARRHGRHFLVVAANELIDDASDFVETRSRTSAEILSGRGRELEVHALANERVTVGRVSSCDVQLNHPLISSLHAVFTHGAGLLILTDSGSKNGTMVNGTRIAQGDLVTVDVGDVVQFGPARTTIWGLDALLVAAKR